MNFEKCYTSENEMGILLKLLFPWKLEENYQAREDTFNIIIITELNNIKFLLSLAFKNLFCALSIECLETPWPKCALLLSYTNLLSVWPHLKKIAFYFLM